MKKTIRKILLPATVLLLFYILVGWKIPVIWRIETLDLPEDSKTVYHTKIRISDVYWLHTKGEKVIRCDVGYEAAKAYIEEHNSMEVLRYIDIYPYGGISDLALYDSQNDEVFWQQPDRDNYITISYLRKWH